MQPNTAEFLAGFDLAILDAAGARGTRGSGPAAGRSRGGGRMAGLPSGVRASAATGGKALSPSANGAHGSVMGGKLDLYRLFAERMVQLPGNDGAVGMVVPSAFHANEGATGIRKLYLQQTAWKCLSFENRKSLFDIHGRFKFALVVARRPGPTCSFRCGFYLTGFHELEEEHRWLVYDRDFICGIRWRLCDIVRVAVILQTLRWRDECSSPLGDLAGGWMTPASCSVAKSI